MEREIILDDNGRYAAAMFDTLLAEVKEWSLEDWNERAAIMEFDGVLTRVAAECAAHHWNWRGFMPPAEGVPQ